MVVPQSAGTAICTAVLAALGALAALFRVFVSLPEIVYQPYVQAPDSVTPAFAEVTRSWGRHATLLSAVSIASALVAVVLTVGTVLLIRRRKSARVLIAIGAVLAFVTVLEAKTFETMLDLDDAPGLSFLADGPHLVALDLATLVFPCVTIIVAYLPRRRAGSPSNRYPITTPLDSSSCVTRCGGRPPTSTRKASAERTSSIVKGNTQRSSADSTIPRRTPTAARSPVAVS